MITTNFLVKKRKISQIDSIPYTGEDNIDTFKFEFDEEWNGLDKTLVIVSGNNRYNIALLHDECVVPFEFYQIKGNVLIGLFGTDGTYQTLATGWLPIYVEEDSYEVGVEPDNLPTQTQWDAFVTEINNLLEQAEASEEHCAEILAQMQEDYETYLASLNQIKDDTEELKDQTQTLKNDTNQIKTDVQGLKRQIEQEIADADLRIDEYNANAQAKTTEFNNNYNTKLGSFNDNATLKTNTFNSNAESKTNTFNQNVTDKTNAFNNNATQKTTAFDDNATSKTNTFNQNAQEKLDAVTGAGTTAIDNIDSAEETAIEHIQEAGESYDEKIAELEEHVELIESNYNTDTATGDNLDITDALNWDNKGIAVVGNTTQVVTTGKQMFDKDTATYINNKFKNNSGVETDSTVSSYLATYIEVLSNTQYTIQGKFNNAGQSAYVYYYDAEKNWISRESLTGIVDAGYYIFTTPVNCAYIQFQFITSVYDADTVMIELGSTATTYEPYTNGQPSPSPDYPQPIIDVTGTQTVQTGNGVTSITTTLHLGDIHLRSIEDYKDRIYHENGKWWLEQNIREFEITTVNSVGTASTGIKYASCGNVFGILANSKILCSKYVSSSDATINNSIRVTNQSLFVYDNTFTDKATAETALIGLKYYTIRQSKATTEITDQTLIDDLNTLLPTQTYREHTIIQVTPESGNPAQIEIKYLKDDRVETNDRLSALEEAFVALNSNN